MKTVKQVEIEPLFVDKFLPEYEKLEEGKLYISRDYGCSHKCFCGCGQHIYINFGKDGWQLTESNKGKVTISPSLQHFNGCKSHYIIISNKANFVNYPLSKEEWSTPVYETHAPGGCPM